MKLEDYRKPIILLCSLIIILLLLSGASIFPIGQYISLSGRRTANVNLVPTVAYFGVLLGCFFTIIVLTFSDTKRI